MAQSIWSRHKKEILDLSPEDAKKAVEFLQSYIKPQTFYRSI